MIDLPTDLPADIAPLAWLLGVWEGTGVIEYEAAGHRYTGEFRHRVSFSHDGGPFLNYAATAAFEPEGGDPVPLVAETGFWRLARPAAAADPGPGLLPPAWAEGEPQALPVRTAEDVELLRIPDAGFPIEAAIAHSDGTMELYLGAVDGPRIDIATDAVVRAAGSKEWASASRMYGLVDGHLLWAWDIAAFGTELRSHASARLARV